jgi:WD40 repeat protein
LKGHKGKVWRIVFSPDGKRLLSASASTEPDDDAKCSVELKVWDLIAGNEVFAKNLKVSEIPGVAFGSDGRSIAVEAGEGRVEIWDSHSGKRLQSIRTLCEAVQSVALSPDGKMLALGGQNNKGLARFHLAGHIIEVHDVQAGQVHLTCDGHTGAVHCMAFGPAKPGLTSSLLATAGEDQTIRLWEVPPIEAAPRNRQAPSITASYTIHGHTQPVRALAFSPDGKRLASVSWDGQQALGEMKLWDVERGQEVLTLPVPGADLAFSWDGNRLAVAGHDSVVRLLDGAPMRELLALTECGQQAVFCAKPEMLAVIDDRVRTSLWDSRIGRQVRRFKSLNEGNDQGHALPVRCVACSNDGRFLATGSDDHTVKMWDIETGKVLNTFLGHADSVFSVTFNQDGSALAAAGAGEKVLVWDTRTREQIGAFSGHTDEVRCVAFHRDGQWLASGGEDKMVYLWEGRTGREVRKWGPFTQVVNCVAFNPNGNLLAIATESPIVEVFDVASGRAMCTLKGHSASVRSVSFSPDGKTVATAGWDKLVKTWDLSGKEILSLEGHTEGVWTVSFDEKGRLASAGADRSVCIWDTKP